MAKGIGWNQFRIHLGSLTIDICRLEQVEPCQDPDLILGFACYGPTPLTDLTYDLYWIAGDPDCAGQGLGTELLLRVESRIIEAKGRMLVIETSSSPIYSQTRRFYLKNGYVVAEILQDFYRDGENRVTYTKKFPMVF